MAELGTLLNYGLLLSKKELFELSKTAGFTQPLVVELFRWDRRIPYRSTQRSWRIPNLFIEMDGLVSHNRRAL